MCHLSLRGVNMIDSFTPLSLIEYESLLSGMGELTNSGLKFVTDKIKLKVWKAKVAILPSVLCGAILLNDHVQYLVEEQTTEYIERTPILKLIFDGVLWILLGNDEQNQSTSVYRPLLR